MSKGFLVISRKVSERILIGDNVELMIVSIGDGKVDIAIKAPREIEIQRRKSFVDEAAEQAIDYENKNPNGNR